MKLSIIIPCYNEEKTIAELLNKIKTVDTLGFDKEVIVINDGSTDKSLDVLNNFKGIKVINHSINKGKGQAIKTALNYISGDFVIIQDADLEYNPDNYKDLLKIVKDKNAKVVYGSRRLNPSNKHLYSSFYFGGRVLNFLTNFLFGTKITDVTTCYKLFDVKLLKSINLKTDRFEFCTEVTSKIAKKGIKIFETPINYNPRAKGEGKKVKWIDGIKLAVVLFKVRFLK